MNPEDVWRDIDDQRRRLVTMLEALSEQEWQQPSLCEGWTVRDVAAHVALQNTPWSALPKATWAMVRHRGMNAAIQAIARDQAQLPTDRLIGEIRDRIGVWRPLPSVTYRESAIDYLVHPQDIAIPLGGDIPTPTGAALVATDRVWSSAGCSTPASGTRDSASSPHRSYGGSCDPVRRRCRCVTHRAAGRHHPLA